jgi:hypothetical protein
MKNNEIKRKNSSEKDDIEDDKDKPIHFKVQYEQNQKKENQLESSPDTNNNKNKSQSLNNSDKKNKDFIIEKNSSNNNNNSNNNQPDDNHDNNNIEDDKNNQYYNLLKENNNNDNDIEQNDNFNDYYYYYLNHLNNLNNNEEEIEPKKIISFATQMYQGKIDPVQLKRKYNIFWQKQNKGKNKYKQKMDELKKVFNPNGCKGYFGYKSVINNNRKRGMSQSGYSSRMTGNIMERPSFDNTKQPLPKLSYLVVPYDYGINDPNYGKEYPINYDRKKMAKLRMLKQPLKYYYPYTKSKKSIKYE